ncbi:MAG: glycosyltransferase [Chitinophagaceae bacterium]
MRIAFFVQYADLNGTYFRWHNLAKALQIQGHIIDVYAGDHNWKSQVREEIRDGVQYYIIPALQTARIFYSPNDPFSAWRRMLKLPGKEYDVYHLFQPFLQAYLPWKWLKRKRKKAVFIYDWDDLWTDGLYTKATSLRFSYMFFITKQLERKIPIKADGVTVCSQFLANKIEDFVVAKKIYNGFWPAIVPHKEEMRIKWKLDKGIFYLGYVGKTADELDWIVDGLNYLYEKGISCVKLIVCGPPRNFMEKSGFIKNENIVYLGEVKPTEAKEIACAVDLGMIPLEDNLFNQSRFPIKFFDFLTVNTPIYLSDVGEISIIGKELPAVYIGPTKKDLWIIELKNVVESLKTKPQVNNIDGLISNFSWPSISEDLITFYNQILGHKNRT